MARFGEKLMQDGLRNFIDLYMQQVTILILNCGMGISSLMLMRWVRDYLNAWIGCWIIKNV